MATAAIIVAAGRGTRAGGGLPKQWQALVGRRVADWTLDVFRGHPGIGQIALVLHPDDFPHAAAFADDPRILLVAGGAERAQSVLNGLAALEPFAPEQVLIHDVARPCLRPGVIDAVLAALAKHQGAAPAIPLGDALWRGADGLVALAVPRDGLYRAQTPQGFHFAAILAAHRAHKGGAADDVEVARAAGLSVAIVAGDTDNLKITAPGDLARAARILKGPMDIRTGNGFDVHAFEPGNAVILCGIAIPHERALKGHSDADVAMHAITDAIYGALAKGDIGRHFPPSDPQWRGAASDIFLAHAGRLAEDEGFTITHVDCTIICETPKIGPHAQAMRERLSAIIGIPCDHISVKATTTEKLGFTGRGEGIAAQATATLVKS
ncbi:MAG: bifunctional 2-C-methyl-D-erythritol 4-phosphate cytidylyltransferase/2-C-methyl-D-erythritol 2,4-cyclodiphosphate synthase [Rhodobacteraceae bacterium]|nr:bifunctional 2-C-methyl-D-erythritol 4-phosphate cytidylyltransferase/2-C-methyl-D-erythritol 2,4-cyclodiphosphate synthase [Paracoccaceae bacterium]